MKKILALALVLVLALGMSVPAFAKVEIEGNNLGSDNPIDDVGDINPDWEQIFWIPFDAFNLSDDAETALRNATATSFQSVMNRIADTVDTKIRARKGGALMTVSVDDPTYVGGNVSVADMVTGLAAIGSFNAPDAGDVATRNAWISYLRDEGITSGATYNAALSLYDTAWLALRRNLSSWRFNILLEAPDIPWNNINEIDFEVDILLHIAGRSDNNWYWTVTGTIANEIIEVDADYDYANGYDGHVIEAIEYVPKLAICGNYDDDVYAHVKMAKDKKIFFVALNEGDENDEPIFDKYPAIEYAYKILQTGLNSYTGNFIELGGVDNTYYIYGKDANGALKYLGRGGELLPLSAKYYISSAKLDLVDDAPIDEDLPTDPVPEENFNPSTGI